MAEELVTVRFLRLPVAVHRRAVDRTATLRRELALVEGADVPAEAHVGERLKRLATDLGQRFGTFAAAFRAEHAAAEAAGRPELDVVIDLPAGAADAAERYGALLDEADELCRQGALVTLCPPPDAVAYRRWFLGEIVGQIRERRPPRPWDGAAEPVEEERSVAPDDLAEPRPIVAEGDLDLLGAPLLRDAIAERVEAGEHHVLVDLSACTFVDSVGLSVLLTARERCVSAGGSFRVMGVHDDVRVLLETVGVLELLTTG